ncbi:hypothetical protein COO60DRAFT_1577777, partial [Scenedesmus sp. NREL 46B-D3]
GLTFTWFYWLSCGVQVCFFFAAVVYKWRMDGRKGAEALVASLAAFGFAEKLLEKLRWRRLPFVRSKLQQLLCKAKGCQARHQGFSSLPVVLCAAAVVCFPCAALLGSWSLWLSCCSWCVETARWCFDCSLLLPQPLPNCYC